MLPIQEMGKGHSFQNDKAWKRLRPLKASHISPFKQVTGAGIREAEGTNFEGPEVQIWDTRKF